MLTILCFLAMVPIARPSNRRRLASPFPVIPIGNTSCSTSTGWSSATQFRFTSASLSPNRWVVLTPTNSTHILEHVITLTNDTIPSCTTSPVQNPINIPGSPTVHIQHRGLSAASISGDPNGYIIGCGTSSGTLTTYRVAGNLDPVGTNWIHVSTGISSVTRQIQMEEAGENLLFVNTFAGDQYTSRLSLIKTTLNSSYGVSNAMGSVQVQANFRQDPSPWPVDFSTLACDVNGRKVDVGRLHGDHDHVYQYQYDTAPSLTTRSRRRRLKGTTQVLDGANVYDANVVYSGPSFVTHFSYVFGSTNKVTVGRAAYISKTAIANIESDPIYQLTNAGLHGTAVLGGTSDTTIPLHSCIARPPLGDTYIILIYIVNVGSNSQVFYAITDSATGQLNTTFQSSPISVTQNRADVTFHSPLAICFNDPPSNSFALSFGEYNPSTQQTIVQNRLFNFGPLPTSAPSSSPSTIPTRNPVTSVPSKSPLTTHPTNFPTHIPTTTVPSTAPSTAPSATPSTIPTGIPSSSPSDSPTSAPSSLPSFSPSTTPTSISLSDPPSSSPSNIPSNSPTQFPTKSPSNISSSISPTSGPTIGPTSVNPQIAAVSFSPSFVMESGLGIVIVFACIGLLLIIVGKAHGCYYQMDKHDAMSVSSVLTFLIYVYNTLTDILLAMVLYQSGYLDLFIPAIVFLIVPFFVSLLFWYRYSRWTWTMDPFFKYFIKWMDKYGTPFLVLALLSGNVFAAVLICHSRLFDVSLFKLHIPTYAMTEFTSKRVYCVILLEDVPHFIIQVLFLSRTSRRQLELLALAALLGSVLSMLLGAYTECSRQRRLHLTKVFSLQFTLRMSLGTDHFSRSKAKSYRNLITRLLKAAMQNDSHLRSLGRLTDLKIDIIGNDGDDTLFECISFIDVIVDPDAILDDVEQTVRSQLNEIIDTSTISDSMAKKMGIDMVVFEDDVVREFDGGQGDTENQKNRWTVLTFDGRRMATIMRIGSRSATPSGLSEDLSDLIRMNTGSQRTPKDIALPQVTESEGEGEV